MKEYAHNLKGTAMFCLDMWKWYWDQGVNKDEACEMIRTGRMYAYSSVLVQITGRTGLEAWEEIINSMQ